MTVVEQAYTFDVIRGGKLLINLILSVFLLESQFWVPRMVSHPERMKRFYLAESWWRTNSWFFTRCKRCGGGGRMLRDSWMAGTWKGGCMNLKDSERLIIAIRSSIKKLESKFLRVGFWWRLSLMVVVCPRSLGLIKITTIVSGSKRSLISLNLYQHYHIVSWVLSERDSSHGSQDFCFSSSLGDFPLSRTWKELYAWMANSRRLPWFVHNRILQPFRENRTNFSEDLKSESRQRPTRNQSLWRL